MSQANSQQHRFQVNLTGMIDLLSNHLYSSPRVYIRELLQNGIDAIAARRREAEFDDGRLQVEVIDGTTLVFEDNGLGLTEEEVHRFLSTIAQSSKRAVDGKSLDFIGQFGIGLLSCFMVSEEIVVITRSAKAESEPLEWRGRSDGTYDLRVLERDVQPGTSVYLRAKPEAEEFFEADWVIEQLQYYGDLLPYPIEFRQDDETRQVNRGQAPWERSYPTPDKRQEALLSYGEELFELSFLDAIPLYSDAGEASGLAFILPFAASATSKQPNRIYLRGMFMSDAAHNLLPEWAFFVRCVVNARNLRPTASREDLYEDQALEQTREDLGQCLRTYLMRLAEHEPRKLAYIVQLHHLALKNLACEDEEAYRLFINWFPYETSQGTLTIGDLRAETDHIRYTTSVDAFRQLASVAAAQDIIVVNGGYIYDAELLERLPEVFPDMQVSRVDAGDLTQEFADLDLDEREETFDFIRLADLVLQPYKCRAQIRRFEPQELPALYAQNEDSAMLRSIEQSRDKADELFDSILDSFSQEFTENSYSELCFNYTNPLIRQLVATSDRELLRRLIELLYVQTLLLGHHPLGSREMQVLNSGLIGLIEHCIKATGS